MSWLATSGVQVTNGEEVGAVHAWLDESTHPPTPGFLYSEITGYFITHAVHLVARGDGSWLPRAESAAAWLVERAMGADGGVRSRKYASSGSRDPWSFENGRVAFFDCAMVGFGLLQLHALTGTARWLEAAIRIHRFIQQTMVGPDGELCRAFVPETRDEGRWSSTVGPFQAKGALFLQALARTTGDAAAARLAESLLRLALNRQEPSGRFPTTAAGDVTHLHPHSYAIEGLLSLGARGRPELLEAARRAIGWSFEQCLLLPAPIQQWAAQPEQRIIGVRADALAQSLRAFELFRALAPEERWAWEDRVPELYALLDRASLPSGGTAYGRDEHGDKPLHANTWCHFFATEARLARALRSAGKLVPASFPIT